MNPDERRRLDRLVAALNADDVAMLAALQPTDDEPEEPDELEEPKK